MKISGIIILLLISMVGLNAKVCEYSYNSETTQLNWTAFKFTEKTGVGGGFDKVNVFGNPKARKISEFARKVKFTIPVESVNSKNPDRDEKIKKFFFGEMKSTDKIRGFFRNVKFDGKSGSAELILKMNNKERSIPVSFTLDENQNLEMKGTLDVFKWGAQKSIESLNKECNALHTGKDGISKLWNEVDIQLITKLNYECK